MTDNNKLSYSLSDLVEELESEIDSYKIGTSEAIARAYAAGADVQLDRDARWLDAHALFSQHLTIIPSGDALRQAMRTKTLKEQALDSWDRLRNEAWCEEIDFDLDFIRRALESLPN